MLAGEAFNVYDPELVKERQYARQLVERFNALGEMNPTASNTVIRQLFGHVGEKCEVHPQFKCDYDCVMLDASPIRIGKHCLLGP